MKTGDEKYSSPATRARSGGSSATSSTAGSRFIELMIPLLIVTMVLGYSGNADLAQHRQHDAVRHDPARDRRHADAAVPAAPPARRAGSPTRPPRARRTTRSCGALQMKFMRLPKPQVKIGQELPEHYR